MGFALESRMLTSVLFAVISVVSFNNVQGQSALVDPLVSQEVELATTSGQIYHNGKEQELVWTETITVPDAFWVRLKFDHIILAGSPLGGPSSTLKITSLKDEKFQILDSETSQQWRNTSAYFNGNSVRLELYAAANGRLNLIQVGSSTAGEFDDSVITETICGDVDERQLSDDPRAARGEPIGCTCWLFDDRNNCLITAGHCAAGTDVAMFNVPLSDSNGNPQFPGPEDQYAVDFDSMQFVNAGIGNDWCYFGCFPNSNTGLTAFQAQGQSYQLGVPGPVQKGDEIRITGYGSTSLPVDPTWDGAQKTHVGQYAAFSDLDLGYRTDTTSGNSGSPIIFEPTGEAIGVHTHGGCNNSGMNFGTSIFQSAFNNALNSPLGVCAPAIDFSFPNGRPELISPGGGDTILVTSDSADFDIDPTSAMLHIDLGAGFQSSPMTDMGNNTFAGEFPVSNCGTIVNYYFSVQSTTGDEFTNPLGSPLSFYSALSASSIASTPFVDDFQTDMDWTVSGDASAGAWERGVPAGNGNRNDPTTDADGSGSCYLTENGAGNTDVDGGATILTSPIMSALPTPEQEAILTYYRWFHGGTTGDSFEVEISNDNGNNWQVFESFDNEPGDTTGGWRMVKIKVADIIAPTDQMRLRFTATDAGNPSIVEAGVDGVRIDLVNCDSDIVLGDINMDGIVNLLDVAPFVNLLSNSQYLPEADINMDGSFNLLDVTLFIELLQE